MSNKLNMNSYVLVTPAHNEEKYISYTLEAIINQTIKPKHWVIVDDGSTDHTALIVNKYAVKYPFISLISMPKHSSRNFSSKVYAINKGLEKLDERQIDYNYFGNLDADVSFDPAYYETLLNRMQQNPDLGIAGGKIYDLINDKFVKQPISDDSVAGAVQLFRKDCYDQIGGYVFTDIGGEDSVAEITARMKGWKTVSFNDLVVKHYKPTGSSEKNKLISWFKHGKKSYQTGYHWLFIIGNALKRLSLKPYAIGSLAIVCGYYYALFVREKFICNKAIIDFLQIEQKNKIKMLLKFN